jgi:hypothetical protein
VSIYREPSEETTGLYPGLVVCDGRVTGSITLGRTRLPLWAILPLAIHYGWDSAAVEYDAAPGADRDVTWDSGQAAQFVSDLLEMRGEFGRLLLVLADAERRDSGGHEAWWETKRHRRRVAEQLRRCLDVLEAA